MTDLGGSITHAPPAKQAAGASLSRPICQPRGGAYLVAMKHLMQRNGWKSKATGRRRGPSAAPETIETEIAELPAKSRARLRPLFALAPYVARYRGRAFLALIA